MAMAKLPPNPPALVESRTVDPKGRVLLPKEFANSTVIFVRNGENEICIRKARIVPEDEMHEAETWLKPLSDRDRDLFLAALENPPAPTDALREALKLSR
jgi:hypothetical protein